MDACALFCTTVSVILIQTLLLYILGIVCFGGSYGRNAVWRTMLNYTSCEFDAILVQFLYHYYVIVMVIFFPILDGIDELLELGKFAAHISGQFTVQHKYLLTTAYLIFIIGAENVYTAFSLPVPTASDVNGESLREHTPLNKNVNNIGTRQWRTRPQLPFLAARGSIAISQAIPIPKSRMANPPQISRVCSVKDRHPFTTSFNVCVTV